MLPIALRNSFAWVTADDLVSVNEAEVSVTREPFGIRDKGILESAAAAPRNHFEYSGEADLLLLAVRLLFSVGKAHAFVQGNKRTAFFAMAIFLEINGAVAAWPDSDLVADWVLDLIEDRSSVQTIAERFRPFVVLPE
jgi:death-on-curing protein